MFVQFTIPKDTRGTQYLGRVIDTCIARCVERWGGCTVTEGTGYWKHPDRSNDGSGVLKDLAEPVAILGVECDPGLSVIVAAQNVVRKWFDNLATYVREKGNQHTVYYRMFDGGEARFVGPDTIIQRACAGCGSLTHCECGTDMVVQPEPEHVESGSFADKVCRSFDTGPNGMGR